MRRVFRAGAFIVSVFLGSAGGQASAASSPRVRSSEQRSFERALDEFDRRHFPASRKILEGLLRKHPERGLYWFNLGNASLKLRDFPAAVRAYRKVVDLRSPLSGPAGLYLAKAAEAEGKLDTAAFWFKWALKHRLPPHVESAVRDEASSFQAGLLESGVESYRTARYSQAVPLLDLAISIGADPEVTSQAVLLKGLTLLKTDRPDEAKSQFERIGESGTPGVR